MRFEAQLLHAEAGRRVVRVRAFEGERRLGSALGEAGDAEEAEERALGRLRRRLGEGEVPRSAAGAPPAAPDPLPAKGASTPSVPAAAAPEAPWPPGADAPALAGASPPQPAVGGAEPPLDPEDWSSELVRLDRQLQRLGWDREQEAVYLQRAFGHPSRNRLTTYTDLMAYLRTVEALESGCDPASASLPLRRADLLGRSDQLLRLLGWGAEEGKRFLERHLGASSRQQLSDLQLLEFNRLLEGERSERAQGAPAVP